MIFLGKVSKEYVFGELVLHKCDNKICVNPSHLFVGTHKDNMVDMSNKGRGGSPCGSKSHWAKLDGIDVVEIRNAEGLTHKQLSIEYGVSRTSITNIINRKRWKHI